MINLQTFFYRWPLCFFVFHALVVCFFIVMCCRLSCPVVRLIFDCIVNFHFSSISLTVRKYKTSMNWSDAIHEKTNFRFIFWVSTTELYIRAVVSTALITTIDHTQMWWRHHRKIAKCVYDFVKCVEWLESLDKIIKMARQLSARNVVAWSVMCLNIGIFVRLHHQSSTRYRFLYTATSQVCYNHTCQTWRSKQNWISHYWCRRGVSII